MARNAKSFPKQAKKVFQGQIFDVYQWEQELFDGSSSIFEGISRTDTAHTIGIMPDGRILLTEDEQPGRRAVITPPGGQLDGGEQPEAAARREFLEETGYEIGEVVFWHEYQPGTKLDWKIYAFIGRGIKKIQEPRPEAGEKIKTMFFTFDEFLQLGRNEKMRDRVIRIILLEALLDKGKRDELERLLYG